MIYTGSYLNCFDKNEDIKTVSISRDKGIKVNYIGETFLDLAPKSNMSLILENNNRYRNNFESKRLYVRDYLIEVLSKLDARDIYNKLNNKILLCYEPNIEICHRHIVAYWLQDELDIIVPEIGFISRKMSYLERPSYIKDIYDQEKKVLRLYR